MNAVLFVTNIKFLNYLYTIFNIYFYVIIYLFHLLIILIIL